MNGAPRPPRASRRPVRRPLHTETADDARADLPKTQDRHARTALLLSSSGFFLITLDILIVNLALPSIREDLGGGTSGLQWVLDGYTLLFAALLLCGGNLADRFGAKGIFAAGIALFAVASVLCSLAPSIELLIAGRGLQGFGAAAMSPASMALIREAFPDLQARARALGVWAAGGAVAAATGPLLGGALSTIDWRLVFAINVPVCAVILVALVRVRRSARTPRPFDWAGQAFVLVALGTLLFAVIEGGVIGYANPWILAAFAVALVASVGFVATQRRGRHPMLPPSMLRARGMRTALLGGFSFVVGWFGTVFATSLFLQQQLGLSALLAGLAFLPSALVSLAGNLASGPLTNRFGARMPAVLGLGSMTVGLVLLALTAPSATAWVTGLCVILVGAGGSVATPPLAGLVLAAAPAEQAGVASAAANAVRQVGGALSIAAFGVLLSSQAGFVAGMQMGLVGAAALGAVSVAACARIRPTPGA